MFLEDKIHGFKYTYISDENVQQTKWYHSSIVLRKVHQFIIKKPMCYVGKAIYKTHGLHRRSTRDTINPGTGYTVYKTQVLSPHALQRPWHTIYNLKDYGLLLLQGTAKQMTFVGRNIVARLVRPGQTRKSHELWSARYVELTITGESLSDHRKHGTHRTFRRTAFTILCLEGYLASH